ncbi:MAG: (2Fe-2S)-binding protein [Streptosporangiales bacterium]|nr:(2Fe-2S)-binding protein [Streptosporangiales bacterium]
MGHDVSIRVNGDARGSSVPDRLTLADYLRERRGLTGTKLGCEQGVCGACTVLLDGASARSCLVLAAQVDGSDVVTVEGLASVSPVGRELRDAFARHDALQCGFCTPGFLVAGIELLGRDHLDEATVRAALSGNLCRCTGYGGIVAAILDVHLRHGATPLVPPDAGEAVRVERATGRRRAVAAVLVLAVLAVFVPAVRRLVRLLVRSGRHSPMKGTA